MTGKLVYPRHEITSTGERGGIFSVKVERLFIQRKLMQVRVLLSIQKIIKNNENYLEISKFFVIFVLWKFFEKMNIKRMPEWWNGRHEGLKIPWSLRPCGFESRFWYKNKIFRRSIGISLITKIPLTGEIYQLSFSL